MAANADISRRKAERRAQKVDKELARLQTLLQGHQRCTALPYMVEWVAVHANSAQTICCVLRSCTVMQEQTA